MKVCVIKENSKDIINDIIHLDKYISTFCYWVNKGYKQKHIYNILYRIIHM